MVPLVTGIVTLGIYKFFELLICRRERREIIGKLEPGSLIDYLKLVPMGLRTGATIRTASETAPGIPAGALKVGCLLLGLGAGLLFGFMLTRITEIQSYDTRSAVYGGSVLVFGGPAELCSHMPLSLYRSSVEFRISLSDRYYNTTTCSKCQHFFEIFFIFMSDITNICDKAFKNLYSLLFFSAINFSRSSFVKTYFLLQK